MRYPRWIANLRHFNWRGSLIKCGRFRADRTLTPVHPLLGHRLVMVQKTINGSKSACHSSVLAVMDIAAPMLPSMDAARSCSCTAIARSCH
mmetsp:Transcript_2554/g.8032  ORF Transcript_2554/g.8032 Transcript_2554/m.8032 type:complete len:91 (-) Transcript_2554:604-876(-)